MRRPTNPIDRNTIYNIYSMYVFKASNYKLVESIKLAVCLMAQPFYPKTRTTGGLSRLSNLIIMGEWKSKGL